MLITLFYLSFIFMFPTQFVLDADEFKGGDIEVKVVGEELVVEGRGDASSAPFSRRFFLSSPVDVSAVTSVMSTDGVLLVTAPTSVSQLRVSCNLLIFLMYNM